MTTEYYPDISLEVLQPTSIKSTSIAISVFSEGESKFRPVTYSIYFSVHTDYLMLFPLLCHKYMKIKIKNELGFILT
jgi:hypothetical protein